MGLFHKYVEIYSTLNMESFFKAKNLLADNNITYKDTSTNNQLRVSFNNLRGTNVILSRDNLIKTSYRLSVKKEDEEKARQILRFISR